MERRESKALNQELANSQRKGAREAKQDKTGEQTGNNNSKRNRKGAQSSQEKKHQIGRHQAKEQQ